MPNTGYSEKYYFGLTLTLKKNCASSQLPDITKLEGSNTVTTKVHLCMLQLTPAHYNTVHIIK
jgi:hypothetical protein